MEVAYVQRPAPDQTPPLRISSSWPLMSLLVMRAHDGEAQVGALQRVSRRLVQLFAQFIVSGRADSVLLAWTVRNPGPSTREGALGK